jgi:hypothetical protein
MLSSPYRYFLLLSANRPDDDPLNLAGEERFELSSSVLETDSLTIELTPLEARDQGTGIREQFMSAFRNHFGKFSGLSVPYSLFPVPCLT